MQKYNVVTVSGQPIAVEGQMGLNERGALIFKNGNEVVQIFAPGAWITVFKASAIARAPGQAIRDISRGN